MGPAGQPVEVNTHDFPSQAQGKAIPYGIYDLTHDEGWVSVGIDHDTSQFAVASIAGVVAAPRPRAYPGRHDADDHRRLRRL